MECFCLGRCVTVCGRSHKWPPIVAFRFHSAWYICTFQQGGTLLCLSVQALGGVVNLVTWNAESGGPVWAREVRTRGWDILSHQKCLVGGHSFGLGKINQTTPPPTSLNDTDNSRPRGSPLSFPHPSITIALPSLFFLLPDWFYWRGNRTQKGSVWEATCYLRVLGIEAAAEASLSAVMKAGRFGRFHSQHSTTPHPHLNAGTASVCLPLASSLVHLPTVPPWPLLPLMGEEW